MYDRRLVSTLCVSSAYTQLNWAPPRYPHTPSNGPRKCRTPSTEVRGVVSVSADFPRSQVAFHNALDVQHGSGLETELCNSRLSHGFLCCARHDVNFQRRTQARRSSFAVPKSPTVPTSPFVTSLIVQRRTELGSSLVSHGPMLLSVKCSIVQR